MKESELNRIKKQIDEGYENSSYVLGYVHALEVCGYKDDAKVIREYATEKKISVVFS